MKKTKVVSIILVYLLGLTAMLGCVMMTISTAQARTVNKNLVNTSDDEEQEEVNYITLAEVYEAPEKYIDTHQVFCGYFCTEFATNTGLAWLSDKKEQSKEDAEHIIRLEQETEIEYTPKAIAVYGKLENIDGALVIQNPEFYLYGGTDMDMNKHNALIDENVVDIVMTALRYDDDTDVSEELMTLQAIACSFGDEELEAKLIDITDLSKQKGAMSQTDFETKAEQLWNEFRTQLLE